MKSANTAKGVNATDGRDAAEAQRSPDQTLEGVQDGLPRLGHLDATCGAAQQLDPLSRWRRTTCWESADCAMCSCVRLVADENGAIVAALCLSTGRAVADPFTFSRHLVDLLRRRSRRRPGGDGQVLPTL